MISHCVSMQVDVQQNDSWVQRCEWRQLGTLVWLWILRYRGYGRLAWQGGFLRKLARVNPWLLNPPSDDMRMCISEALSCDGIQAALHQQIAGFFSFIGLMKVHPRAASIGTFLALTRFSFLRGRPPSAVKLGGGQPYSKALNSIRSRLRRTKVEMISATSAPLSQWCFDPSRIGATFIAFSIVPLVAHKNQGGKVISGTFYTIGEVANLLGRNRHTIARWIKKGWAACYASGEYIPDSERGRGSTETSDL